MKNRAKEQRDSNRTAEDDFVGLPITEENDLRHSRLIDFINSDVYTKDILALLNDRMLYWTAVDDQSTPDFTIAAVREINRLRVPEAHWHYYLMGRMHGDEEAGISLFKNWIARYTESKKRAAAALEAGLAAARGVRKPTIIGRRDDPIPPQG